MEAWIADNILLLYIPLIYGVIITGMVSLRKGTNLAIRWLQVAEGELVQHGWHQAVFYLSGRSLSLAIEVARVPIISSLSRTWVLWFIVWSMKLTSAFRSLFRWLLYKLLLCIHQVIVRVFIEVRLLISCFIGNLIWHLAALLLLDVVLFCQIEIGFVIGTDFLLLLLSVQLFVTILKHLLTVCRVKACSVFTKLVITWTEARCVLAWVLSDRALVHQYSLVVLRTSINLMYLLLLTELCRVVVF